MSGISWDEIVDAAHALPSTWDAYPLTEVVGSRAFDQWVRRSLPEHPGTLSAFEKMLGVKYRVSNGLPGLSAVLRYGSRDYKLLIWEDDKMKEISLPDPLENMFGISPSILDRDR